MTDPLLRLLADLPAARPDSARAARIRARCHTALARQHRPRTARPTGVQPPEALVAALGGGYFVESLRQILRCYGIG